MLLQFLYYLVYCKYYMFVYCFSYCTLTLCLCRLQHVQCVYVYYTSYCIPAWIGFTWKYCSGNTGYVSIISSQRYRMVGCLICFRLITVLYGKQNCFECQFAVPFAGSSNIYSGKPKYAPHNTELKLLKSDNIPMSCGDASSGGRTGGGVGMVVLHYCLQQPTNQPSGK